MNVEKIIRNNEETMTNLRVIERLIELAKEASDTNNFDCIKKCTDYWQLQRDYGNTSCTYYFVAPYVRFTTADHITDEEVKDSLADGDKWYELVLDDGNNRLCEISFEEEGTFDVYEVTYERIQRAKVKVVLLHGETPGNACDYVDTNDLDQVSTFDEEYEEWHDVETESYMEDATEKEVRDMLDFSDDSFGEDNLEED